MAKYFKDHEMYCKCGCGKGPEKMADAVLELADKIREEYGRPLIVNSAYRCGKHNRHVGGAKNSQHVLGTALDLTPVSKRDVHNVALIADRLNPNGGVGIYPSFVHVDSRGNKARW